VFTVCRLLFAARAALIAENLFLRRQLALFQERKVKPRRIRTAARLGMLALARCFEWRESLVIVKPETFIKWHRTAFRMFWQWKSRRRGRPPLPKNLRELIREMGHENPTWAKSESPTSYPLSLASRSHPGR
jgi:putative transposase